MQEYIKRFLIRLVVFSTLILIIGIFLFALIIPEYYLPVYPFVFGFFIIVSMLIHMILLKANQKRTAQFVPYYMLSMFIKLMIYLAFMGIYVFADRTNAIPFLITFLSFYFLYTMFEVISILPVVRKAKE